MEIAAPNVAAVQAAIEYIYPLVYEFRKERTAEDELALTTKKRRMGLSKRSRDEFLHDPDYIYDTMLTDEEEEEEEEEEEGESDASWD